jgi:hypothetical protein
MRFNTINTIFGLLAILATSPIIAEDSKVDDFSSGTNENYYENYWFYWDDDAGTKAQDRPQKAPDSTPSVINVPYGFKPRHAAGVQTDTFKIKDYQFLVKQEGSNKYGCMPFTFGTRWECVGYTAYPFVGIGTELAPDGEYLDLTGATAITFRLRSHVNDLQVNFRLEIKDVIKDTSGAHYFAAVPVPKGSWKDCTIRIPDDLAQPTWANDERAKPYSQTQVAKISWEVHREFNRDVSFDTLDIDDIVIKNFNHVPRSLWTKEESARPATGLFSTFNEVPKNETPFKTYWYAYNDNAIAGNSSITQGATVDPKSSQLALDWSAANTGFGNAGSGAAVGLQFGKTVKQGSALGDTTTVQGFIGIGVTTYDSAGALYFNNTTGKLANTGGTGSTESIYFEYLADGDYRNLTLEILDWNDVPDKFEPKRKDKRGAGIVWYRNLPMTGPTTWHRVCIPFDSLVTHSKWKGYTHIPLDKTKIAKVQFKAQGPEGSQGVIQIDNVFFPGITFPGVPPIGVKNSSARQGIQSTFRAFSRNGLVRVNWKPLANFNSGKISLIDSKGAIIKSNRISPASELSLTISTEKLPAGLYFVQLTNIDGLGKANTRQCAVTVLK